MKLEVIIPVGPGHEELHHKAVESIRIAELNPGPFSNIDISVVNDTEGKLGRSRARNLVTAESDADWIFYLDADDRIHPKALESVIFHVEEYDAIWGNIWEYAGGVCAWRYQVPEINSFEELIAYDPYLTLQIGHFVKRECVIPFDEEMNVGEDFKYYLEMWRKHRCVKIESCLYLNQRGMRSTGPKSGTGAEWSDVVGKMIRQARGEKIFEESKCGPGSSMKNTETLRKFIPKILKDYDINAINDLGCGDLVWLSMVDMDVDYTGYDAVIRQEARDRAKPHWKFVQGDIRELDLEDCDLVICKDVFRHHDEDGIKTLLKKAKSCGKYLLSDYDASHDVRQEYHREVPDGEIYNIMGNEVDLRIYLGEPIADISSGEIAAKRYGLWKLDNR